MSEPNAPWPIGRQQQQPQLMFPWRYWARRFWWVLVALVLTLAARAVIDGVRLIRAIMRGLI